MVQCPQCNCEIQQNFGMVTCEQCKAVFMIDFSGQVEVAESDDDSNFAGSVAGLSDPLGEPNPNTQNFATADFPSLDNEDSGIGVSDSSLGEISGGDTDGGTPQNTYDDEGELETIGAGGLSVDSAIDNDFQSDFAENAVSEFGSEDSAVVSQPLAGEVDFGEASEPVGAGADHGTNANMDEPSDDHFLSETRGPEMSGEAASIALPVFPQSSMGSAGADDRPVDITAFANSSTTTSGAQSYDLILDRIDNKALRDTVAAVLSDPKLELIGDKVMAGLAHGRLLLPDLHPLQAKIIIEQLQYYDIDMHWQQRTVTMSSDDSSTS